MTKLKVMTILGTRPEIIRLARVMARFDDHVDHVIVHTGQNWDYELNEVFFEELSTALGCYGLLIVNLKVIYIQGNRKYSVEEFRQIIDINLMGTFHVNKVVVEDMRSQNYGRIVNISSIAGKEGNPNG